MGLFSITRSLLIVRAGVGTVLWVSALVARAERKVMTVERLHGESVLSRHQDPSVSGLAQRDGINATIAPVYDGGRCQIQYIVLRAFLHNVATNGLQGNLEWKWRSGDHTCQLFGGGLSSDRISQLSFGRRHVHKFHASLRPTSPRFVAAAPSDPVFAAIVLYVDCYMQQSISTVLYEGENTKTTDSQIS